LAVTHQAERSPKSSDAAKAQFRALVPDDERVVVRPMFGSVAAFIGGNMFMGLVKDEFYVRLDETQRQELARLGGRALEVMPGRPMKEYVTLPDWQARTNDARAWAARSLDYALTLPPKKK
jgi:TfoX/Sxy family transcriptional regulator of competence genes